MYRNHNDGQNYFADVIRSANLLYCNLFNKEKLYRVDLYFFYCLNLYKEKKNHMLVFLGQREPTIIIIIIIL